MIAPTFPVNLFRSRKGGMDANNKQFPQKSLLSGKKIPKGYFILPPFPEFSFLYTRKGDFYFFK